MYLPIINFSLFFHEKRFSTSRQTLSWIPDTFFTALLSGRISSLRDESGAIFIDRDPLLFSIILNFLRTKDIDISKCDIRALRHEAEYYSITPLIKRLALCEDLNYSSCGDVLFYGYLPPPTVPLHDVIPSNSTAIVSNSSLSSSSTGTTIVQNIQNISDQLNHISINSLPSTSNGISNARPGSMVRVPELSTSSSSSNNGGIKHSNNTHSRNSSWDLRLSSGSSPAAASAAIASSSSLSASNRNNQDIRSSWISSAPVNSGHSRTASFDLRHSRNSSADLNKYLRNDVNLLFNQQLNSNLWIDPLRVQIIKAHHNWIAVAYAHFITCYRLKDSTGWQLIFTSPYIDANIERIAINAKVNLSSNTELTPSKMIAISYGNQIRLWGIQDDGQKIEIGIFNLNVRVEYLFFIGSQLVALSSSGKIGVWHAMTQHWQIQDLVPILSFDSAGSFLLLGCNNGSIYYIGK